MTEGPRWHSEDQIRAVMEEHYVNVFVGDEDCPDYDCGSEGCVSWTTPDADHIIDQLRNLTQGGVQFVVDVERHNDGDDGLFGPFPSRDAAQQFIDTDDRADQWATIRPIHVATQEVS